MLPFAYVSSRAASGSPSRSIPTLVFFSLPFLLTLLFLCWSEVFLMPVSTYFVSAECLLGSTGFMNKTVFFKRSLPLQCKEFAEEIC